MFNNKMPNVHSTSLMSNNALTAHSSSSNHHKTINNKNHAQMFHNSHKMSISSDNGPGIL